MARSVTDRATPTSRAYCAVMKPRCVSGCCRSSAAPASPMSPAAAALVEAVAEDDRAVWATAFYAGLRLGELWALRDEDVDLEAGVIRVERSWDRHEGFIEPKSRAGR